MSWIYFGLGMFITLVNSYMEGDVVIYGIAISLFLIQGQYDIKDDLDEIKRTLRTGNKAAKR